MLQDIFKYMLPYDQEAHPVEVSRTAPYGVVNHWLSIEGQFGKGGSTFLSGSITTALRNVYGGMMGFEPALDAVVINPCLPSTWKRVEYQHSFRQAVFHVVVENPGGVCSGVKRLEFDGKVVEGNRIPLDMIAAGATHRLKVFLG